MTLTGLREYGLELIKEEQALLFRIAMGEATADDQDRYSELTGTINEIERRLHRAYGDGGGLTPTPIG